MAIHVESVTLSEGGYVAIHDAEGDVLGHSTYLNAGTHEDVLICLGDSVETDQRVTAMAHLDTDDDRTYEFDASDGERDGPYTEDGSPVTDDATVTVDGSS